jgi:hypothetical protein
MPGKRAGSARLRSRVRTILLALACALLSLWTAAAGAEDRWSDPFPGVRRLRRTSTGPRVVHVLVVDLCAAGVSLRATRDGERRRTVPSWGDLTNVDAAVNGDFFSFDTYSTSGAAMGNGEAWGPADHRGEGLIAFGSDRVRLSPDAEVLDPLPSWMRQVVSGKPLILRAGEVVDQGTRELCTVRHPRTAVGLSRDRQTLYLMVVDGRSSSSIGMTCAEEATTLRGLGAWDALNLDGGGSSAMWLSGTGVVNAPSDGSPRVVANHLGVNANGSGMPGSCMPWEPEEDELAAGSFATTTSDVDGDGIADACARSSAGIVCSSSAIGAPFAGPALSDANGWRDRTNYSTIAMGDVTGDGLADLCARANAGLRCYPSTGAGFGPAIALAELTDDGGWDAPEHYATIRLADIDGDGDDDVCARAAAGFRCWRSDRTSFAAMSAPIAALSDSAGGDDPSVWSTIRMGDVDGDGLADVCARTSGGLSCWRSTGTAFEAAAITGPAWSDTNGWSAHRHYSTIRLADVDGDGSSDVCARGGAGLRCHLSHGDGFGPAIVIDALSDEAGYDELSRYATIALADVDADGDRDVCARGAAGVGCWLYEGGAFGARRAGPALSDESSWWRAWYWRSLRFADVDGDGDDDLCARAAAGLRCWYADGGTFGAAVTGPEWSNDRGWWADRFHGTIRIASAPRMETPPPMMIDAGMIADPDAGMIAAPDAGMMGEIDAGALEEHDAGVGTTLVGGCSIARGAQAPFMWWMLALLVVRARSRR